MSTREFATMQFRRLLADAAFKSSFDGITGRKDLAMLAITDMMVLKWPRTSSSPRAVVPELQNER
ncbi:hypothetical protein E4U21_000939 [Claviceps maximensis]|nr:hypothetical protein E4U21_000939 [Claviceps maximensis]